MAVWGEQAMEAQGSNLVLPHAKHALQSSELPTLY